ncbi:MAG TPA: prenyltransferase/squalene oxidase repeat-containing protein [Candidatus Lustribacter sp.]|nr:prenyltransferase/squalene oxidase repeat-containing protein [Candidatus Lustribacter sp.]
MPFPREQGFDVEGDTQSGDIFQRAAILDALADLRAFDPRLDALVERESQYLIDARGREHPGGWSYFPGLRELPPDADDLAQIMQALIRNGRENDVIAYCAEPLAVLLDECSERPGVFETWIVPRARDARYERQRWWIANAWGAGPDAEVIANLLYALTLHAPEQYADVIRGGMQYVVDQQNREGVWSASWYHGPFYPTYVACRCIASGSGDAAALDRARSAVLRAQRSDGGWGFGNTSDALSTAFALLTLPRSEAAAKYAIAYLTETQESDGGWAAVPWIKMELGRAEGMVRHVLSYGSRTITCAYVLRALATAYR